MWPLHLISFVIILKKVLHSPPLYYDIFSKSYGTYRRRSESVIFNISGGHCVDFSDWQYSNFGTIPWHSRFKGGSRTVLWYSGILHFVHDPASRRHIPRLAASNGFSAAYRCSRAFRSSSVENRLKSRLPACTTRLCSYVTLLKAPHSSLRCEMRSAHLLCRPCCSTWTRGSLESTQQPWYHTGKKSRSNLSPTLQGVPVDSS